MSFFVNLIIFFHFQIFQFLWCEKVIPFVAFLLQPGKLREKTRETEGRLKGGIARELGDEFQEHCCCCHADAGHRVSRSFCLGHFECLLIPQHCLGYLLEWPVGFFFERKFQCLNVNCKNSEFLNFAWGKIWFFWMPQCTVFWTENWFSDFVKTVVEHFTATMILQQYNSLFCN